MVYPFFLIAGVIAFLYMRKVKQSSSNDDPLTLTEKIIVILTEFFAPYIAGPIYYYGWRRSHPGKAKQANIFSFIIYGIWIILIFILVWMWQTKPLF